VIVAGVIGYLIGASECRADDNVAPATVGMKFKVGLLCDHPQLTYDLIKVVNDKAVYEVMFLGHGVVSGRCIQTMNTPFTLVRKWKTVNTSYDGYPTEMWEVRLEDDTQMWAIIWPTYKHSRVGTRI
jgi:hypothetical protein